MRLRIPFPFTSRGFELSLTSGNWREILGAPNLAGIAMNEQQSLQIPSVYACVTVLSKTLASLPLFVYKRLNEDGKIRAPDHPLYSLLHDEANPEMTAMVWRETACGHLYLWGNSYSEIEYDEMWQPKALWPLRPDHTWAERDAKTGELQYSTLIAKTNQVIHLPAWRVLHVPLFGFDGLVGKSPVRLMMDTFGMTAATIQYGAQFFGSGAKASGVLTHPGTLSQPAQDRLREAFDAKYSGMTNAHRTMVLEEGLKYERVGIPPDEAQWLESRKFNRSEIASIYGVPPHLIGDLERSTNNNIEHQGIEFQTITMRPLCVRFEQELTRKCLSAKEKQKYFIEHNMDGLARGDMSSRYDAYSKAINGGWMCPDEARRKENQNPMPNGQGQVFRIPANVMPAGVSEAFWLAKTVGKGDEASGLSETPTTQNPPADPVSGSSV